MNNNDLEIRIKRLEEANDNDGCGCLFLLFIWVIATIVLFASGYWYIVDNGIHAVVTTLLATPTPTPVIPN